MSGPRTRLTVLTNTNVRFLTSLPSSSSLRKALPLLLNTYRAVVSENLGNDHELLEGQSISSLTKKGCLIARDEVVGDVLSDNDEIRIEIREGKGKKGALASEANGLDKHEKLQIKKRLKGIMENEGQKAHKKSEEPKKQNSFRKEEKVQKKNEPQNSKEHSNSEDIASKMLNKFRSVEKKVEPEAPKPKALKKAVKIIEQDEE